MIRRVALVTGASSGIGTAIVLRLVADGFFVMAAGRDRVRTERLLDQNPNIQTWVGDITAPDACAELMASCIETFGRLDVLVNNAGVYEAADAENTSDENWSQTIAVNLTAPFYLSREAIPHLRQAKGAILNIASDWGLVGGKEAVAYCASKGGVVLMTKAMALDHAKEGIRVNAICPGDVETPMLYAEGAARGLAPQEAVREADRLSPTGRVTTSEEVAALVAFLASDGAAQITGAAIPIDGGNSA
jgi:meso-butanediol dehydrogenase/(S,S)-butanediol dehydrogenase/diacetyl reductase